ncbi:MAG: phenylacetate-CoA oxygenase subunit PaaC [Saprospiraceae bacterium]|nr:phenylacetate-CoA oxygenase subunit PaaC [Saprospiraceae bacterium]
MTSTWQPLDHFLLMRGDDCLVLGHRLSEWCGHGPVLEQDMALTNIALDLIGQARLYYQYAGARLGQTEDQLAYLRTERNYFNAWLVEQPNGDFAHTIVRQFYYDWYENALLEVLEGSADEHLAAIAAKSRKEARYHRQFSSEWVIRLGDGTEESHQRMQVALNRLLPYVRELFENQPRHQMLIADGILSDVNGLWEGTEKEMKAVITEATLSFPVAAALPARGRDGLHTEHLGYLLTELQYMQRTYPGLTW